MELDLQMEGRCAYAVLVMVAFWMTDAIPMAITSLMPVFLFPLLGILGTSEVCKLYIRESIMMFLGMPPSLPWPLSAQKLQSKIEVC
ncbi:unnamed protein product [Darwinula stevensoni]|uniref:Uncharacterized protein n=1 Tax=Darwinula stevensoni TaxID=69355 RepID=A0A7R9FQ20_9CRUS|nr:unnamed protein product [Darwinula stevensoni]CAG0898690.1 unnamed protein product [Darwinula stevensoni]